MIAIGTRVAHKIVSAHRLSWELHNGPIPKGMQVHHHCDNPSCVNPRHLWVGSQADNVRDMDMKGRRANIRGEANPQAKLTKQKVYGVLVLLKKGDLTLKAIGERYGVAVQTVSHIKAGTTWGWLRQNGKKKEENDE